MRTRTALYLLAAILLAKCTTPPPLAVTPQHGEARYLIDPRIGWEGTAVPAIERRFDAAWRLFLAGDFANARSRLAEISDRQPDYAPAELVAAAIDIREGNLAAAHTIVDRLLSRNPRYTAASVYAAELDVAENRIRYAYDRYGELVGRAQVPAAVSARFAELQTRLFDQLYRAAINAPPAEAIPLLRDALLVTPSASAARLLLAQKLIASHHYDEAQKELDPLLNTGVVDRPDVQEALAEIDIGLGRYQEAVVRYERLARRDGTGRYTRRLEEIKEQFAAANMPPQIVAAMNAETITRADLAVLMYWNVASIRFAQDVPTPPIAIDISDLPGRDEMIRAIALGIFQVDPTTRQVYPEQIVNGTALARIAARILTLRGAACARHADPVLDACGIANPAAGAAADLPVNGRTAAALLLQVDRAISR